MAALFIIILLLTTGGYASVYGNQPENAVDEIMDVMVSCGFENVRVSTSSDALVVEYENRIYFREKDAIRIVIEKIMEAAPNVQTLILVPKKDDVPLFQISVSKDSWNIDDKLEASRKVDHALAGRRYNSSVGKVDIVLRPELNSLLGRTTDPFIYQFAIAPEFSTFLGKGIRSSAQVRFLLHDDKESKKRRVALDRLCLDYTHGSPASTFMNLGGGYFGDNRYGLASEFLRFGWNDRLGIGGTAAWLGNMYYGGGTLYYTRMWKWTALANLYCRLPFWDVLLTTRLGQFLYRDRGVSVEITRFFHNTNITVFAAKTNDGSIGGLEIQFLPYPRRHLVPHRVRVRLPTILKMRYRYEESGVGVVFSPGHYINPAIERFWLIDLE